MAGGTGHSKYRLCPQMSKKRKNALKAYTAKGRRAEVTTKILANNLLTRLKALLYELFNTTRPLSYLEK